MTLNACLENVYLDFFDRFWTFTLNFLNVSLKLLERLPGWTFTWNFLNVTLNFLIWTCWSQLELFGTSKTFSRDFLNRQVKCLGIDKYWLQLWECFLSQLTAVINPLLRFLLKRRVSLLVISWHILNVFLEHFLEYIFLRISWHSLFIFYKNYITQTWASWFLISTWIFHYFLPTPTIK